MGALPRCPPRGFNASSSAHLLCVRSVDAVRRNLLNCGMRRRRMRRQNVIAMSSEETVVVPRGQAFDIFCAELDTGGCENPR